ncbi:hypothetical protein CABS01_06178 [Colletotrichum abscissum]|uniref:uncharacterized protein n=1 Tax=Colletotrichum abscissum TaxID=1671311 RepID=UPI0027D4DC8A|nr:uncharacterized protein CABS01_06178 [Colletotrichum abscissum]KAK1516211.1 hypothetical protein CABS01_06178 [Colletotrichum abscissum]
MGDCALPSLPLYISTSLGFTNWQANIPRARPDSKGECETCEFALRAHKTHIVRQVAHYASVSVPYTTVILIHTAHRPGPLAPVGSACGQWHLHTFRNDSCPCNCVLSLILNLGVCHCSPFSRSSWLRISLPYLALVGT